MVAVTGMLMSSAWADVVPIDAAAAGDPNSPPYILESVTVGGVEVPAGELMTGTTSWITSDPNDPNAVVLIADPNMDDPDINTMLQWSGRPGNFQIIFDELWYNTNGERLKLPGNLNAVNFLFLPNRISSSRFFQILSLMRFRR